ncbi:MAG: TonB-dependent receptor [Thermoanaerobaculia bacterium]|nr:TonB-dependent receptor [Thermoanaerobaculia bacterium]
MNRWRGMRSLVAWAALVAVGATAGLAQSQTGNVYGSVKDDKGEPLPGVTLTLSGGGAPLVQVSDAQGQFRFIGVYPGTYKLDGNLEGFSPVVFPALVVNLNRNTTIELAMNAAVSETITITAESPLLDPRKVSTGATVDKTELEKIPTARDPWVILQTTPGVLVDRVNVGGNESGQQSQYVGNGDDGTNSSWSIDGVEITDIGAIGSSSSYYDFDAFEEMQVTTGGSDSSSRTGGVGINLVTKRGTNEWRGSARYLVSDQDWQSDFNFSGSDFPANQPPFKQGNRIVEVLDYGFEVGGPILKDKLWVWGSYGENDIQLLTSLDFPDNTLLETWNAKLNWQVAQNNSATLFFSNNDKTKVGRDASPTRPPETTFNQAGLSSEPDLFAFFSERPSVAKLEDTHIFGSNFFLTGMYSEVSGGFSLSPQGGFTADTPTPYRDRGRVWHNSFLQYQSERPQDQYKADGSYFFSAGNLNHELKFGVNRREATVESFSRFPGFGLSLARTTPDLYLAVVRGDGVPSYDVEYTNAYVQDTLTTGNLTINAGLRYDKQTGALLTTTSAANWVRPDLVPAVTIQGRDLPFEWEDLTPRLGLTYALGEEKKTLLRASYSRFAEQIGGNQAGFAHPLYFYPAVYIYAYNTNGIAGIQPDELDAGTNFGPNATLFSPNSPNYTFDSGYSAPLSDEIVLGVEHALAPEFVVGLAATMRKEQDIAVSDLLVFDNGSPFSADNLLIPGRPHRADDYVLYDSVAVTLPDGTSRDVPVYGLRSGVTTRGGLNTRNSDIERDYLGVSLTLNKRLANRWMMRGNVTWNDWEWSIPSHEVISPNHSFGGGDRDGERVLACSGTGSGAKGAVCISSSWSFSFNGLYQVAPDRPWGFNLAASVNGREGYAKPLAFTAVRPDLPAFFVTQGVDLQPDAYTNDDVYTVDLRVEKEFKFDRVGLTVGVDVFNALNEGTVLQTEAFADSTNANFVREVLSPRIFRVGARISLF